MYMKATPPRSPSSFHNTMLSVVHPHHTQEQHYPQYPPQNHHLQQQEPGYHHNVNYHRSTAMPHRVSDVELTRASSAASTTSTSSTSTCSCDDSVAQALEIARESPDGAQDSTVSKILDGAIRTIWGKVEAAPQSYVMTRDEFSVFNYFQYRFKDNTTARLARARYWDHASA